VPCCENLFLGRIQKKQVLGEAELVKDEAVGKPGERRCN